MRSNSGSGKSSNNLHDPTMKEHEESKRKGDRESRRADLEPAVREGPAR